MSGSNLNNLLTKFSNKQSTIFENKHCLSIKYGTMNTVSYLYQACFVDFKTLEYAFQDKNDLSLMTIHSDVTSIINTDGASSLMGWIIDSHEELKRFRFGPKILLSLDRTNPIGKTKETLWLLNCFISDMKVLNNGDTFLKLSSDKIRYTASGDEIH